MKARSSSPFHVHVEDVTPVHVHVQRSRSLPSSTEKALIKTNITPKQAEKICSVIRSRDFDFEGNEETLSEQNGECQEHGDETGYKSPEAKDDSSAEEPSSGLLPGSRLTRDDLTSFHCDQEGSGHESRLLTGSYQRHSGLGRNRRSRSDSATTNRRLVMKTLVDAEAAANSAAIQLVSFKDVLAGGYYDSRFAPSDDRRLSRQRSLLLEKLEAFKLVNKSVRQQLKELQEHEANRLEADRHVEVLLKKLTQAETENLHLKRDLCEKERRVDELMDLRKREMENIGTVVQLSKSVEATRAHLQGQLRNKESENNRLTVQLRGMEKTLTEQKLEIDGLKGQMSALTEKASQEKDGLKKAARAQKQRAERFEAAIERCYDQMKGKDARLAEATAEADTWKEQCERTTEGKAQLEAQISVLKLQIADVTAQLQRERDTARASNEDLLQKVETLNSDSGELQLENATLKASIADLEEKLSLSAAELQEQTLGSQKQKDLAEQYQTQVADLQKQLVEQRTRFEDLSKENEMAREGKNAEVEKVKEQLEARVTELEQYPDLLSAAEQTLHGCQENLSRSQRRHSDKSESLRQLQVKVDKQVEQLKSSVDVKRSIEEANAQLQLKFDSLQRKLEEIQLENKDLVHKLASQEEALHYSSSLLEQRSAQCLSLTRQLEGALTDVKQQVSKVKETATVRERSLQSRILELEAEKSRRGGELKRLRQSKQTAEKHYEVRLKDLQLSLDQSESHKQSIQNYVDFLKNSYATMFEDGLSTNLGCSVLK